MHNFLKPLVAFLACSMLFSLAAQAQFQLNVLGSRTASLESVLSDGQWGTGATLRYFVSPRVAVGLNARYFSSNSSYSSGNFPVVVDIPISSLRGRRNISSPNPVFSRMWV